jgi:general secretion pathway protein K
MEVLRVRLRQQLRQALSKGFSQPLSKLHQPVQNERGVAILIAVACIMMITYFAMEITYDSNVEYIVNSGGLNRIKAYYAAKAGVDLSLMRIKVYQKVQAQFGKQLGDQAGMLDEIWRFPFAWPLPITPELNSVDKDSIKKLIGASLMDASYIVTIEDEGSKIDLNDLNSVSKVLRDSTKKRLVAVFEQRKKNDPVFERAYSSMNFTDLVGNIQDWMSATTKSDNGNDKRAGYSELSSAASKAGTTSESFPPNRSFRTLAELHMVPGITDAFYDMLAPIVTIYGMKGINPNLTSKEIIKSLDPGITDEIANEVIKRREDPKLGGPYKDAQDFWNFVTSKNARLEGNPKEVPLIFDTIMNFRIRSSGEFAGASKEITAIVMDVSKAASKMSDYINQEKQAAAGGSGAAGTGVGGTVAGGGTTTKPAAATSDATNKGPPRIVYWNER